MASRPRLISAPGAAAVVAGITIAVSPFAFSLTGNASSGQRILDRFRYTLSVPGLAALKSSYTTVMDMSDVFLQQTLPDIQRRLHKSPAAYQVLLKRRYPVIASAQKTVPPVFTVVNPQVPGLLALHSDFSKVDSLPVSGVSATSVPWLLVGVGVVLLLVGVGVFSRPRRVGAALVAVIGAGLIAVPLALSLPGKADAAVRLQKAGAFVFSPKIAPAALGTTGTIDRMVTEINSAFLPGTASQLHWSRARMNALIGHHFPAVAQGLAAWPSIRPGAFARARDQVASVEDQVDVQGIDVRAVPWFVIGPGILMLVVGAIGFALYRAAPRRAVPAS